MTGNIGHCTPAPVITVRFYSSDKNSHYQTLTPSGGKKMCIVASGSKTGCMVVRQDVWLHEKVYDGKTRCLAV